MVRTVISLEHDDKTWLDRRAKAEKTSMAEVIRRAVRRYRDDSEARALPIGDLLERTSGIWSQGDGLSYQQGIRGEWDDRD